jgi:hypothetical protein
MMRAALCAAVFLVGCGASAPSSSDDIPNDDALPFGAIIGYADNWRLTIDPTQAPGHIALVYDDDLQSFTAPYTPPQSQGGGRYRIEGGINVDIETTRCTRNELAYPMRFTAQARGQEPVTGCAAMRWDYQLLALLPQIDACIAASPNHRVIRYAGMHGEQVVVRMESSEGQVDCLATAGAAPTAQIVERQYDIFAPTEGDAVFMRGPGENPGGECYSAPEVRGADNQLIGWMLDPVGC